MFLVILVLKMIRLCGIFLEVCILISGENNRLRVARNLKMGRIWWWSFMGKYF